MNDSQQMPQRTVENVKIVKRIFEIIFFVFSNGSKSMPIQNVIILLPPKFP